MTQHYVGTKIIVAWPAKGAPKARVCGVDCHPGSDACNGYCTGTADSPATLDPVDGYAVKYPDGYQSWSPAAAFEAAYLPLGHIGGWPEHVQRMLAEHAQLDDRITKGETFAAGPVFARLPELERALLLAQLDAMRAYRGLLSTRITLATD